MNPQPETLADLQARLRVLEQENDLLAERAEEISLLGLVAEQGTNEKDPKELLTGVLERVCILKALPYGACLAPRGALLVVQAAYQVRQAEGAKPDSFKLGVSARWPPTQAVVLSPADLAQWFSTLALAGPAWVPTAAVLVPLKCHDREDTCLVFLDDQRSPQALALLLPVLERVADLTQARLDNLSLLARLGRANLQLEEEVAERTAELRRSEARYRTLFDHVPDGVLLVDADADDGGCFGHIENANAVAAHMHGYTQEALQALDIEALNAPDPGPNVESFEHRVWRLQPGDTVQEELLHLRQDGSTFPVEAIGSLVRLQDKQKVLIFMRDITDRKRAQKELLQRQRTESVGLLAGGIAHDFNNLLTAIMGQTSIALDLLGPQGEALSHLHKAQEAAAKASVLTRQMLAYSGRGQFTVQPMNLNDLIQENLRILEAALPKQIRFELELAPELPLVLADEGQWQQVIMNLVINGAEAIGAVPGTLCLRTRAVHLEQIEAAQWPLCGKALGPGDFVYLEVQDSGAGMSPELLARVFDPFFTTKAKGHGLGLSAVQGIVRGHRGALGVDSVVGQGTTFRILLPAGAFDPPQQDAFVAGRHTPTTQSRVRRVLVVDDEEYMLEVIHDSLALFGHQAVLTQSGEAALAWLEAASEPVDLVLLDLTMPGLGGIETFRRIRERHPQLPVVLSSGFALEEATAQLGELDLASFLQKPYPALELIRVVEAVPLVRAP